MTKSKKNDKTPSVKVEDLAPENDPKGGALNFSKIDLAYKDRLAAPTLKIDSTNLALTDSALKMAKG